MPNAAPSLSLREARDADRAEVEALFDAAFGPGRYAKTAERVREGAPEAPELSILAVEGGRLVGAARQHRVTVGEARGTFLGPFAVADQRRGAGIGPALIESAVKATRAAGLDFVLLVGPQKYFGPLGFAPVAPGSIATPGPVDPARLLVRPLREQLTLAGRLAG